MKFDILTLFPEMFAPLEQSIIGRAVENNRIEINLTNIRDFSKDKHKKVDDTPYGGGKGMVIRPDVVYDAYESVKDEDAINTARLLAKEEGILCGISSGAAMFAAIEQAMKPENKNKLIVVILPDTGERYLSSVLFDL